MTAPIEKLTLHNFRGASGKCEIAFDTSKKLVMIFGENGTGKSTIVDSIDFVANRKLGSIEDRSIGTSRHGYLPTITKNDSDLNIELICRGTCWKGRLSGMTLQVTGGTDNIRARVLRRSRLLNLVESQPAERYKGLLQFIDVSHVENAEQALRDAVRNTVTELNQAVAILEESTRSLSDLWATEGSPGSDALEWAKSKSEAAITGLAERIQQLRTAVNSIGAVTNAREKLDSADSERNSRTQAVQAVDEEIAALPPIAGTQAIELVELLQKAQATMAAPSEPTSCPVCEQSIVAAELRSSIQARLTQMAGHREVAARRYQAERLSNAAISTFAATVATYVKSVRDAATNIKAVPIASPGIPTWSWSDYSAFLDSTSVGETELPDAKAIEPHLTSVANTYREKLDSTQADLNQHNAIKGHYDRIGVNRGIAERLTLLKDRLDRSLTICEDTRRAFTQAVLDDVQGEVNRLYALIHPNEPLGPLRLSMNPNKRHSIEQDATFAGHTEVPPQAYFSESHLDTLGFCVWLALAKRDNPKDTIILLDDVFTSVDGVHLTRIMNLLVDIVKDFAQVIVTTHYRTWRDRFRLPLGPGLAVQLLELHHWSLQRGICVSGTKLAIAELEAGLATQPLDRQAVASRAGILLEAVLDRLTLQYRRRVPRTRDGDLTLGDFLSSCKKLFEVLVVERTLPASTGATPTPQTTVKAAIQPFFQEVGPWNFIRNQVGCHFNFSGSEVADADVEAFGKATVALIQALACHGCGDVADRRDGSHFRCSCKQTKMTPLEHDK